MAQVLDDLVNTAAEVKALIDQTAAGPITMDRNSPARNVLGIAYRMLLTATDAVNDQLKVIRVYADPLFYEELPPSKAAQDKGQYAKQYLATFEND